LVYVIYLIKTSDYVKVIVSLYVTQQDDNRMKVFSVFPLIVTTDKAMELEIGT
jgi:hypothetical protein